MPHQKLLGAALQHISGQDWEDRSFSLKKAYVCALFSEMAYLHVPEFELENDSRVKIVPCRQYQEIVRKHAPMDVAAIIRGARGEGEFGPTFTVQTRDAVALGVRAGNVVFIGIRGTKYLYDWLTNLNAGLLPVGIGYSRRIGGGHIAPTLRLHNGFYGAALSLFEPIRAKIRPLLQGDTLVYVTGHSLGGAIAAIFNTLWVEHSRGLAPRMAYTFGMPRYADSAATHILWHPHHVYNERDIVPSLPPRWMGYGDCPSAFRLDGREIQQAPQSELTGFARWIGSLAFGRGIAEHAMELYRGRLEAQIR